MTVDVIGGGARERASAEWLTKLMPPSRFSHAVILPIPTTRDGVNINGTDIALSSLVRDSLEGVLFCSYALPYVIGRELSERGGTLADVAEDEEFTEANAALTAECTLSYIMKNSTRSLSDLKVGIVGYGRIGRRLLELLLFHGADVRVFTRKNSTRVALSAMGADAQLVSEADFDSLDFLVNTAPAGLFGKKECESIEAEVLELAPGENFTSARRVTRLPSLPARMLPETGGRLYAEAALRQLARGGDLNDK